VGRRIRRDRGSETKVGREKDAQEAEGIAQWWSAYLVCAKEHRRKKKEKRWMQETNRDCEA
jgi:hypothetical protein